MRFTVIGVAEPNERFTHSQVVRYQSDVLPENVDGWNTTVIDNWSNRYLENNRGLFKPVPVQDVEHCSCPFTDDPSVDVGVDPFCPFHASMEKDDE